MIGALPISANPLSGGAIVGNSTQFIEPAVSIEFTVTTVVALRLRV